MDLDLLIKELGLYDHLLALAIGMPRLFMVIQVVPFMAGTIVTGQLRSTIVFACYLVLHPAILAQLPQGDSGPIASAALYAALMAKESLIGLLLGFTAGIIFWAIQSAGFFIDNQRGASMAAETDPLSGEQTSPLGSFLFQSMVYLFFAGGAFTAFLGLVYASYTVWPAASLLPAKVFADIRIPLFFVEQVSYLMLAMLMLASPIVIACLLTDVSLGLINRFASQLNVYVLAMPIKSGIASFLLLFYFSMLMTDAAPMFMRFTKLYEKLQALLR